MRIQQAAEERMTVDYQCHPCKPGFSMYVGFRQSCFDFNNTGIMKKLLKKTKYNPETGKQSNGHVLVM